MLALLVSGLVHAALLVAAIKVFMWARRVRADLRWSRRIGLALLLVPPVVWLGELLLPEVLHPPLAAAAWVRSTIDAAVEALLDLARENTTPLWVVALKPLAYAAVYGGLGLLIGWPLDRAAARRKREEDASEEAEVNGQESPPAQGP